MRKIIIIGESALRITFHGNTPVASDPCGVLLNTAALLGRRGRPVSFVSELAADQVGDIILGFLTDAGVDTHSVDRFTGGSTQLQLSFDNGRTSRYGDYRDAAFTVVWPRIDPDDILLFGGNYAVDPRSRARLFEMVRYARERRATVIYVPDFDPARVRNITHLMPAILESFEAADIAVTTSTDLSAIFGLSDPAKAFRDHIAFYTDTLLNLASPDSESGCGETAPTLSVHRLPSAAELPALPSPASPAQLLASLVTALPLPEAE